MQSSQAEEAIFDQVFVHFLHQLFVIWWLLEICLIYPVKSLKAPSIQVFNIDLHHRASTTKVLVLLDRVQVESLIHQLVLVVTFRLFFFCALTHGRNQLWLVFMSRWRSASSIIQCRTWFDKNLGVIDTIFSRYFCSIEHISGSRAWIILVNWVKLDVLLLNRGRRAVAFGLYTWLTLR